VRASTVLALAGLALVGVATFAYVLRRESAPAIVPEPSPEPSPEPEPVASADPAPIPEPEPELSEDPEEVSP